MSADVIIRWGKNKPDKGELQQLIKDFFGPALVRDNGENSFAMESIQWEKDRWFVALPGIWSHPYENTGPASMKRRIFALAAEQRVHDPRRFIEVWPSKEGDCVYLMTRMTDPYTGCIRDGLAKWMAHLWDGKVET